jgi:Mg2+/citrate symporter
MGRFRFSNLTSGSYELLVNYPGFKNLTLKSFKVSARQIVSVEAILLPSAETVTVGILTDSSLVDTTSSSITTIISGEMIRRLPIP